MGWLDELRARLRDRRLDPDTVRAAAGQRRLWVLANGPFEEFDRVGVFGEADPLVPIADGVVRSDELDAFCARLATACPVARGEWDAMWATPWQWAWVADPLRLHAPGGLVLRVDGDVITARGEAIEARTLASVTSYVDPADWSEIGVRLDHRDGRSTPIARVANEGPGFDPTYDGLCLLADAAWAVSLGRAIAAAAVVPWVDAT